MTDVAALKALRERVAQLNGPDRKIDAEVWSSATGNETHFPNPFVHEADGLHAYTSPVDGMGPMSRWQRVPPITASLDAAISLVEKMLPGWAPGLVQNLHHSHWVGSLSQARPGVKSDASTTDLIITCSAIANTPALALVAAAIDALISQAPPDNHGEDKP